MKKERVRRLHTMFDKINILLSSKKRYLCGIACIKKYSTSWKWSIETGKNRCNESVPILLLEIICKTIQKMVDFIFYLNG